MCVSGVTHQSWLLVAVAGGGLVVDCGGSAVTSWTVCDGVRRCLTDCVGGRWYSIAGWVIHGVNCAQLHSVKVWRLNDGFRGIHSIHPGQ